MSEEPRRAGLLLRTAAKIIDFILIAAVMELIPRAGYFAGFAYLLLGDGLFDGRSIGKKLIKLRVVSSESQAACSFRDSILRNSTIGIGYALWSIPWIGWVFLALASGFEFVLLLGSTEGKRLGDEFSGTIVIEN